MTPERIDAGQRRFVRANFTCASCGEHGHSVWSCPVEAEKDKTAFAAMMEIDDG